MSTQSTDPSPYRQSESAARRLRRPPFGHVINSETVASPDEATMSSVWMEVGAP
ncbi:hypothetical protein [Streptomyces botrytidirepellens]|uniref:hypothetical protein n=1 Tax=Streptomyces botrytidirepellens TaxID=2486417 RepID=UPI0016220BEC|nr:hypothetical protein [Streptomyces botrytidirepellens]